MLTAKLIDKVTENTLPTEILESGKNITSALISSPLKGKEEEEEEETCPGHGS